MCVRREVTDMDHPLRPFHERSASRSKFLKLSTISIAVCCLCLLGAASVGYRFPGGMADEWALSVAVPVLTVLASGSGLTALWASLPARHRVTDESIALPPVPHLVRAVFALASVTLWFIAAAYARRAMGVNIRVTVVSLVAADVSAFTTSLWLDGSPWGRARLAISGCGVIMLVGTSSLYVASEGGASSYPPGQCSLTTSVVVSALFICAGLFSTEHLRTSYAPAAPDASRH